MKNKIGIIIVFVGLIALSACDNLITDKPESALTQINFFTTQTRINEGLMGCYEGMATIATDEWKYTEIRSDNTCIASTGTGTPERVDISFFKFFSTAPSMPEIHDIWYKFFQNISNVNAILPSVAPGKDYVANETLRAQYEGELLFMRAFHYYKLVNLWGDMFKVTSVIGPIEAKEIVRSPVSEVYNDIIIPDLIKATNELPESYSSKDVGRITKWAAKSLLAKTYMMIGGDANLALAKGLLSEVLAAPQYGLLTDRGKSPNAYANIFDVSNEMNKEIIFAIRYKGGAFGIGSPFWGTFAPEGSANLLLKIGTPTGNNNPTNEIMNLLKSNPKDTMRANTCFKVWNKPNSTVAVPYVSKFVDPNISQSMQGENDWIEIRYADIVLLYAEILAQDGNYAIAHEQVNLVRARAGIEPLAPFGSKEEALDAVYKERRLELAFENQRWFDLLRMNKSYNDPNKAMSILKAHTFTPGDGKTTDYDLIYSKYTIITKPDINNYINDRLLLPIPQTEITTNNIIKIPQNPSY